MSNGAEIKKKFREQVIKKGRIEELVKARYEEVPREEIRTSHKFSYIPMISHYNRAAQVRKKYRNKISGEVVTSTEIRKYRETLTKIITGSYKDIVAYLVDPSPSLRDLAHERVKELKAEKNEANKENL